MQIFNLYQYWSKQKQQQRDERVINSLPGVLVSSQVRYYVCKHLEMSTEDEDTAAGPSDLPSPPRIVVGKLFSIKM